MAKSLYLINIFFLLGFAGLEAKYVDMNHTYHEIVEQSIFSIQYLKISTGEFRINQISNWSQFKKQLSPTRIWTQDLLYAVQTFYQLNYEGTMNSVDGASAGHTGSPLKLRHNFS